MSDPGSSGASVCFIRKESLSEVAVLVKEKGVKTLLASSVSRNIQENVQLLTGVNEILRTQCLRKEIYDARCIKQLFAVKTSRSTRSVLGQFNFREQYFLCGERLTEEFLVVQRKVKPEKRNNVMTRKVASQCNNLKSSRNTW